MKRLILASNNKKKLLELQSILRDSGIEVISQRDAGCSFEVEENGSTFEENAYLKAIAVTKATGEVAVADDSGLCVDYLDGAPGLYSARFTGNHEDSDEARVAFLLEKMQGAEDRKAKFVSAICCTFPNGDVLRTRGECPGSILTEPRGNGGFGYDPVFQPDGYAYSMAEMGTEVKNQISHRAKALAKFKEELRDYNASHK